MIGTFSHLLRSLCWLRMEQVIMPGVPFARPGDAIFLKTSSFLVKSLRQGKSKILEIGCGTGEVLKLLSLRTVRLMGVDLDRSYLQQARSNTKGEIPLLLMNAERLAFKENVFDAVILLDVLEHILDDEKALKEICRVLKPGGQLIVRVPNKLFLFELHGIRVGPKLIGTPASSFIPFLPLFPSGLRKYFATVYVYTFRRLSKLLSEAGFSIEDWVTFMPTFDTFNRSRLFSLPPLRPLLAVLRKISEILESTCLKKFGALHLLCAEKEQ